MEEGGQQQNLNETFLNLKWKPHGSKNINNKDTWRKEKEKMNHNTYCRQNGGLMAK